MLPLFVVSKKKKQLSWYVTDVKVLTDCVFLWVLYYFQGLNPFLVNYDTWYNSGPLSSFYMWLSNFPSTQYNITYMWNLEKWYRWTYWHIRNRVTGIGNKFICGYWEGKGGDGTNWEIGVDIYTSPCIKQIVNENLLFSTGNSIQ